MDDWDDVKPTAAPANDAASMVNKWAGEDADLGGSDEDTLLDDWDAEPEPEVKKEIVVKPKALSKAKMAKKVAELEREARRRAENMTEEDRLDAKFEAQRLVEESDNRLAEDLFGGCDTVDDDDDAPSTKPTRVMVDDNANLMSAANGDDDDIDAGSSGKGKKGGAGGKAPAATGPVKEAVIKNVTLNTKDDFDEFGKQLVAKFKKVPIPKNKFTVSVLKMLLQDSTEPLSLDQCNELKSALMVVCSKKQKAAQNKKKKGKHTASVRMNHHDSYNDYGDNYDDFM